MNGYVLGIDSGGTKTRVLAIKVGSSLTNSVPHEANGGPCTLAAMTAQEAVSAITACVNTIGIGHGEVLAICAAVAGWSFVERRLQFTAELSLMFPNAKIEVIPDFIAAYRNAQPQRHGIHTIAGTGSIAYGEAQSGASAARAGGYGYLIDDSGSGYGVGRAAIAASLHAIDGTGQPTCLGEMISDRLKLSSPDWDSFISSVYGGAADRVVVASLAEVVALASEQGDEVARHILHKAGGALARLTEAVYRRLVAAKSDVGNDSIESFVLTHSGSLWKSGVALVEVFERSVYRFAPKITILEGSEIDAARGALDIALELIP